MNSYSDASPITLGPNSWHLAKMNSLIIKIKSTLLAFFFPLLSSVSQDLGEIPSIQPVFTIQTNRYFTNYTPAKKISSLGDILTARSPALGAFPNYFFNCPSFCSAVSSAWKFLSHYTQPVKIASLIKRNIKTCAAILELFKI